MGTSVKTGLVRFSYPSVFSPKSMDEGGEKYGISIIIPKKSKDMVEQIEAAIKEAWAAGKAKGFFKTSNIPSEKNPLKDGDEREDMDPAYADCYYINAYSHNKPGLLDKYKEPITNPDAFYAGCYGRVTLNFYPFGVGKKGVAAGLNNIQKLKEGDRLDGRKSAEAEFDDDFADDFADDDDFKPSKASKSTADEYDDL